MLGSTSQHGGVPYTTLIYMCIIHLLGQSHRRHYLYWPRTGIYQSDTLWLHQIIYWWHHVGRWHHVGPCFRNDYTPIYSCRSIPIHGKHSFTSKESFTIKTLKTLFQTCQIFCIIDVQNVLNEEHESTLSIGCFVFTSTTSQYSVKHQKKLKIWQRIFIL